jgi:RNA polymerase sigma factor (sigma-70 family)
MPAVRPCTPAYSVESWLVVLEAGDAQAAWDLFSERYRSLILATIRRLVREHDDAMDVFSSVCEAFAANEFRRLKHYAEYPVRRASAGPWVVAVVRNLTIDWIRARDGRRRGSIPDGLSPAQREIYTVVCIEGRSCVEAYEVLRPRMTSSQTFPEFLRDVNAVRRIAPCPGETRARRRIAALAADEVTPTGTDPAESADTVRRIAAALASQPDDVRLALELFVVDRLPAEAVARTVGWPNAKAVYNRVYRALAALRTRLEADGIGPGDL